MNAITVRLPWALAIGYGVKLVENRGRPVPDRHIGERWAIHAGATWDKTGAADSRVRRWWYGKGWREFPPLEAADFDGRFRNVVAVATLVDCHEAEQPHSATATCCSPWGDRRYGAKAAQHLVWGDVVALPVPVGPVAGWLSVPWTLPDGIQAQVDAQVEAGLRWEARAIEADRLLQRVYDDHRAWVAGKAEIGDPRG